MCRRAMGLEQPLPGRVARQVRVELLAAAIAADAETLEHLTTQSTAAHRETVEAFLFDRSVARAAREEVLATLARNGDDHSLALLATCLRQTNDPELQAWAAELGPDGLFPAVEDPVVTTTAV